MIQYMHIKTSRQAGDRPLEEISSNISMPQVAVLKNEMRLNVKGALSRSATRNMRWNDEAGVFSKRNSRVHLNVSVHFKYLLTSL